MDDSFYDLHVLPPNPTPEQKAEPLVIENITKDATVEFLKRVIAKKVRQASAWREIKLYFVGEEMIDSQTLESYELADKDIVTAVSAVDVRQRPKPETKKSTVVKATTEGSSGSQAKGRQLKNLAFNFSGRTIMMEDVDLGTTFGKLRERVVRENNLGAYNIYFIFGTRKLDEDKQLEIYALQEGSTIFILERLLGGGDGNKLFI